MSAPSRLPVTAVLVSLDRLNPWNRARWGVDRFRDMGLSVLYFDARRLLYPRWSSPSEPVDPQLDIPQFDDPAALDRELARHRSVFALSFETLRDARLRPLTDLFEEREIPSCQTFTGLFPPMAGPNGVREWLQFLAFRARRTAEERGWAALVTEAGARMWRSLAPDRGEGAKPFVPTYSLLGGLAAEAMKSPASRPIYGHVQDYEMALGLGLLPSPAAEPICVFLDQGLPGHRDMRALAGSASPLPDPDWYYGALARCFRVVEQATGLRVVVIPHPRYLETMAYLPDFEARPGRAIDTVARSQLVLGHFSTALGLGPIFDRPVIQLVTPRFARYVGGHVVRGIRSIGRALRCAELSMENPRAEDLRDWRRIDMAAYANYRRRYIKHPSSAEGSIWDRAYAEIGRDRGWPAPA